MDIQQKNLINPGDTYLGTFGEDVDEAAPLFNLKHLGIPQGIQREIQEHFHNNGQFRGNVDRNDLIDKLFTELKTIDPTDDNGNNKLDDACNVMKSVADPNGIEDLLTKYEKGPNSLEN